MEEECVAAAQIFRIEITAFNGLLPILVDVYIDRANARSHNFLKFITIVLYIR